MLKELQNWRQIVEGKKEQLVLDRLPYDKNALAPALSKDTLDYHYGNLARGYVDRFNKGEGDPDFNRAGAFLHNILFAQYQSPKGSNPPKDSILEFIDRHFDNYVKFKEEFAQTAMKIQGSGWVYLSRNGSIKTITNHQIRNDIVLLIDWWEHAWALDYQHDKSKYLDNQWRIINWAVISQRLNLKD